MRAKSPCPSLCHTLTFPFTKHSNRDGQPWCALCRLLAGTYVKQQHHYKQSYTQDRTGISNRSFWQPATPKRTTNPPNVLACRSLRGHAVLPRALVYRRTFSPPMTSCLNAAGVSPPKRFRRQRPRRKPQRVIGGDTQRVPQKKTSTKQNQISHLVSQPASANFRFFTLTSNNPPTKFRQYSQSHQKHTTKYSPSTPNRYNPPHYQSCSTASSLRHSLPSASSKICLAV